jgi:hypothetical protein
MQNEGKRFYAFGPFRLDTEKRVLRRDSQPIASTRNAVETLLVLVQNAGCLVEKDDLMKQVSPDAFVEEGNLAKNIFRLRKVLGEYREGQEYIETVPTELAEGSRFLNWYFLFSCSHLKLRRAELPEQETPVVGQRLVLLFLCAAHASVAACVFDAK